MLSLIAFLQAVKKEELAMESVAELLGISHRILRKRFIDIYGQSGERKATQADPQDIILSTHFMSTSNYEISPNDENTMELDAEQDDEVYDLPSDEDVDSEVVKDKCDEAKEPNYYTTRSGRKTVQVLNQDNTDKNTDWDEKQRKKIRMRQKKQGPSAEQLLAKEDDKEVLELQKAFVSGEKSWKEGSPKKRKGGAL